jgi:hypothetical protein
MAQGQSTKLTPQLKHMKQRSKKLWTLERQSNAIQRYAGMEKFRTNKTVTMETPKPLPMRRRRLRRLSGRRGHGVMIAQVVPAKVVFPRELLATLRGVATVAFVTGVFWKMSIEVLLPKESFAAKAAFQSLLAMYSLMVAVPRMLVK